MGSGFKWAQFFIPFIPVIESAVMINAMHFCQAYGKRKQIIFMTSNSKLKSEQSQALSFPAQIINQKGSESLQKGNNVYSDKFICKQKIHLSSSM